MTIDFNSQDSIAKPARKKPNIGALVAPLQAFNPATKEVTRRRRASKPLGPSLANPDLSPEERLLLLQERYPEAPRKILEAIASYETPFKYAGELHRREFQSRGTSLANTAMLLYNTLQGKARGFTRGGKPNAIILASSHLTGWPLQAFSPATQQVTRRIPQPLGHNIRNPNLSRKQRLRILQKRYPEAPEILVKAVASYRTPYDFAKAIHEVEPIKSGETSLRTTGKQLSNILTGKLSGWNKEREPNAIIQAAANLTGWPVDDFVPVLDDGDRLDDLRRRYPEAKDALLQVIVPFKACHNFVRQLIDVEPLKSGHTTLKTAQKQLCFILKRQGESDLKWKKEADGIRRPNDVIQAVAAFTGLDHRYFLRPEDGGIPLKRGQRIAYDGETGKYSIVGTAPKAAPRFPGLAA